MTDGQEGSEDRSAAEFITPSRSLSVLAKAVDDCRGCDLYKDATQGVFGEGPKNAPLVFVGEQPGDQEDLAGKPFVGPAGKMLDKGLAEVGIDRSRVYVTNAVKHFKWEARGKRRLHAKPNAREVKACQPWLLRELELVKPRMLVALGATAAQSLFGRTFSVMARRGEPIENPFAPWAMATVHPSSLLRAPDEEARRAAWEAFVKDLRVAADAFKKL